MQTVLIIGGGQLGSRHLQALKLVIHPLLVIVVDPSNESLDLCRQRYKEMINPNQTNHQVTYSNSLPKDLTIDICIVATSSKIRRHVVEELLEVCKVRFMILEKLLFQKYSDYDEIEVLFLKSDVKAWVNCNMRAMPFYSDIKKELDSEKIIYQTTGSLYNLITNSIHYIDHMAYLSGCIEYTVNTDNLEFPPIQSKRAGYLELNGMLSLKFKNGSIGNLICLNVSDLPVNVEITTSEMRCISREWEGKAWVSKKANKWLWEERDARVPFQSELTSKLVNNLIESESCVLVPFSESCKIHKPLHAALIEFLNKNGDIHYDYLPFT
jgi:hypothetical protein